MRQEVRAVHVEPPVVDYILDLVERTRRHKKLALGASPRAALGLYRIAQAEAYLSGRSYVAPDDVKTMAVAALAHRCIPRATGKWGTDGSDAPEILLDLVEQTEVPA